MPARQDSPISHNKMYERNTIIIGDIQSECKQRVAASKRPTSFESRLITWPADILFNET